MQLKLFDVEAATRIQTLATQQINECQHRRVYLTSVCNACHCLDCGIPIDHECEIVSPAFLKLEYDGYGIDFSEILDLAEPQLPKLNRERKMLRQWFVPRPVAQTMAALAEIYCPESNPDVLEPTCGAGMLLAVCASPIARRLIGLDVCPQPNWTALKRYGIEFYDTSEWGQMGSLEFNYEHADSAGIPSQYGLIMMHPPFGAGNTGSDRGTGFTRRMRGWAQAQPHLRRVFDTDVYAVFVGHFLRFLKPGGVMVALTPASWWFLKSFAKMRKSLLFGHYGFSLVAAVDITGHKLWRDASVDCVISVIRSGPPDDGVSFLDARKLDLDILATVAVMNLYSIHNGN